MVVHYFIMIQFSATYMKYIFVTRINISGKEISLVRVDGRAQIIQAHSEMNSLIIEMQRLNWNDCYAAVQRRWLENAFLREKSKKEGKINIHPLLYFIFRTALF